MSRFRNFSAILIMAVTLCAIIPQPSRANDTTLNPTGYVPSDIDRSHIDNDPPILRRPRQDYALSFSDAPLPVSYDIRQHGRFPGIRNQNPYGTCWAFSALGSLESSYLAQYPSEDIDLSEMHLAYFVYGDPRPGRAFEKNRKNKDILEQGGNEYEAIAFLSRMGTVSESVLPYPTSLVPSKYPVPDRLPEDYKPAGIRLKAAYHLPLASRNPEITKRFVMETGGVGISYINDNSAYYKSASGKTAFFSTNKSGSGHAVLVIGWDDDFPREYFNDSDDLRPKNNGAWLIRNSWGSSWWSEKYSMSVGDEGCFWMSYEQYLYGTSVFVPEKSAKSLRHYGYDYLGYRSNLSYRWNANVFRAEGNEDLKYVGFQTAENNQSHDIYVYDLGTESPGSPVSGTLIASLEDVYTPYTGYHTVEISGHVDKGHYFSVVMKGSGGLATSSSSNPGESYGSYNGETWQNAYSTPCIKAFTIPDPDTNLELKLVEISPANFPDDTFREYLKDYDLDGNGWFSAHELEIVKSVKLPKSGLHTLKGVEHLTSLISLDVSENHLTALDLDANTSLSYLSCSSQDASGLILTQNGGKYSVMLKGYISGDISRVIPGSVKASSGDTVYDSSSGKAEFNALASSVSYSYDTGFSGQSMNVTAYVYWEDDSITNIDAVNFPDDSFRAFIRKNCDKDNDGWLSETERNNVKKIRVTGAKVSSVKGIEFFPALTTLYVSSNNLTAVDVSKNTALTTLDCASNKITNLDLSKNTALTYLSCGSNQLTALDVSRQENLTSLQCGNNQLSALNVSKNTALTTLYCYGNKLGSLDVSRNTALKSLRCYGNEITALDVSACVNLQEIRCGTNCLSELNLTGNTNLLGIYSRSYKGTIYYAYADYDGQKRGGLITRYSGGKYTVSLSDYVSDIARVRASSVKDSAGNPGTYDSTSGIATFDSRPADLVYEYDTGYTKIESEDEGYRYMDVAVTRSVEILTASLPDAKHNKAYSVQLEATGGSSLSWTLTGNLPEGLTLSSTGLISGTPRETGTFTLIITAGNDTRTLTLTVSAEPPAITTAEDLGRYSTYDTVAIQLEATGATPITWAKTGGNFPEGLTLGDNGSISGTPSREGSYSFNIEAKNAGGRNTRSFTLEVFRPAISIKDETLPEGVCKKEYSFTFTAEASEIPDYAPESVDWTVSGNLPEGLSFSNGTISGIPKEEGSFIFTVKAVFAGIIETEKSFTLTVINKGIEINAENFPDEALRRYVKGNFDTDKNGWLNDEEIASATKIQLNFIGSFGVESSLKGIEYFTELRELDCRMYALYLTGLDLSHNTKLVSLDCPFLRVDSLDLSANTELVSLNFMSRSRIKKLSLSKNKALKSLYCYSIQLEELDLSGSTMLETLYCSGNSLQSLDLSNNTALKVIDCSNNQLAALDVSKCTKLEKLSCSKNSLTALDLSKNTALKVIDCNSNHIARLDLSSCKIEKPYSWQLSQTISPLKITAASGDEGINYLVRLGDFLTSGDMDRITVTGTVSYDKESRTVTLSSLPYIFRYNYDTRAAASKVYMEVTVNTSSIPEILTPSLPKSYENKIYSARLTALCSNQVSWDLVSGDFPDGLSLDMAGKISGTPTKTGDFTFTVKAENSYGRDTKTFTVTIDPLEEPAVTTPDILPEGYALTPYNYALTITGQPSPTVTATGLPYGMSISSAGEISGTTAFSGSYSIRVKAMNKAGVTYKSLTLKINYKKDLKITPADLPNATWGKKYTKKFAVSGLNNPAWEFSGNLPEGLSFDSSAGTISGIPNEAGTFSFTLTAGNGGITLTKDCTLKVKGIKPKLTGSLKGVKVGTSCSYVLKASGTTPITWSITGLPSGMSYDVNTDGTQCVISGTPSEACRKISVKLDNSGGTLTKNLSFNVSYVKPAILTKSLNAATAGNLYTARLEASGSPVISWSWNVKTPPEGWTLTEDGTLSGTPGEKGKISLKVKAVNPGGKATKSYSLTVSKAEDDARLPVLDKGIISTGQSIPAYTESLTGDSAGLPYVVAAILPAVSVDEEGLYEFSVSVSDDVPDGELVLTGADEAFFLDDDGEITTAIPESRIVTVDVWLEPEKVYELAVLVKVSR